MNQNKNISRFLRVRINYIFLYNFNIMENIVEPNETFDFSKLSLAHPVGIQGGAYFTKIENNKKPLYIQSTKSQTRQGFVKTGKKYYIDLMFDKNAEDLIHWFENLENCCQKLIYEKRETWFQNGLEESDIESAFNSTIRLYKSGKYYLLRTNIKNNHQNEPSIKIYNEQKSTLKMEDVTIETNFISILEIQGIKFTSRNFQIEIELKQIMILDNEPLFDNFLIKTTAKIMEEPIQRPTPPIIEDVKIDEMLVEIPCEENIFLEDNSTLFKETRKDEHDLDNLEEINDFKVFKEKKEIEEETISLDFEELEENDNTLSEVANFDDSLEKSIDVIQLKKPNQVYFEIYKEARNKAKLAKRNAIIAYLEAKNIKKTYMIENLMDSDSDFDAEIDEVSESELEDL
jgi:hypothetical protein